MKTNITAPDYKSYRFPPEIISHVIWLSFRSAFSHIKLLDAAKSIMRKYENLYEKRQLALLHYVSILDELRLLAIVFA
jgi:putative transposase